VVTAQHLNNIPKERHRAAVKHVTKKQDSDEQDETDAATELLDTSEAKLAKIARNLPNDAHDTVAAQVYGRLRLRYGQLRQLERLAHSYKVHTELQEAWDRRNASTNVEVASTPALPPGPSAEHPQLPAGAGAEAKAAPSPVASEPKATHPVVLSPGQRAYHLAVADLFVEKALTYLEARAESYRRNGHVAQVVAFASTGTGAAVACFQMVTHDGTAAVSGLALAANFSRSFTAYGMIVLTAVGLWRYGKAALDQAERLLERRHALRQGRLFVHLNEGKLSIEEMEKAFNWNVSQSNAFGNISTDMQAPWGSMAKEVVKAMPDLIKAGLQAASGAKPAEGGSTKETSAHDK
jgi:hypothetical protein